MSANAPLLNGPLANLTKGLTRHQLKRQQIKRLDALTDCDAIYNSIHFQECLRLLQMTRNFYAKQAGPEHAMEKSAQAWAEALARDEDWAWIVNHCRITATIFLFKLVALLHASLRVDAMPRPVEQAWMARILSLCVYMDRANVLYNMVNHKTQERGLGKCPVQE